MSDREQKDESREMVADIVKELRRQSDSEGKLATQLRKTDDDVDFALASCYAEDAKYLSKIADRIEAAWKRELEKVEADALSVGGIVEAARTAEKSLAVGNSAAMLDALTEIRDTIMNGGFDGRSPAHFVNICDAALAAPARNCDVGTAEERNNRFRKFCGKQPFCEGCKMPGRKPLHDIGGMKCALAWAQMPYEAQEGDGK